jgi:hypothetical protein
MDTELVALASSGATTLVGLMVGDAWAQARTRFAALLGGGRPARQEAAEEDLDEAREELLAARERDNGGTAGEELAAEWRNRLRRALAADPAAVAELRALLAELTPQAQQPDAGSVHNEISGRISGPVVQGHTFGSLAFGVGQPPATQG